MKFELTSHDSTPFGAMKPSLQTGKNKNLASQMSAGFILTKYYSEEEDKFYYYFRDKEVLVSDIIWNKEEGVLTFEFDYKHKTSSQELILTKLGKEKIKELK